MTGRGLSTMDLDGIRTTLASGRKPKVVFTDSAGQIAGQAGQVVALRDPTDADWVVVRFGRDELPFAPTDLAMPQRRAAQRTPKAVADRRRTIDTGAPSAPHANRAGELKPAASTPRVAAPDVPSPREEAQMPGRSATAAPVMVPPSSAVPPANGATSAAADPPARPARRAAPARVPKVKAPPSLTVTLSYTDGDWFVGAQQGSKALAKPYVINAAEALRMVCLLDVPGVQDAVGQIIAAERADAHAQAERLRAELAEIEARLAGLPTVT